MSELRFTPADPAPALGRSPTPNAAANPTYAPAACAALGAMREVLRRFPVSRDALRAEVVRFAAVAREHGATAAELTEALERALAPALASFPAAVADDVRVHVGWWAAHGYHRAD